MKNTPSKVARQTASADREMTRVIEAIRRIRPRRTNHISDSIQAECYRRAGYEYHAAEWRLPERQAR